jgi:crossover junction endodeoxyribonuclease RusA
VTAVANPIDVDATESVVRSGHFAVRFVTRGVPVAQGSKSFKGVSRSGRAILVESAKGLKPWRELVNRQMQAAAAAVDVPPGGWPLLGPLAVQLVFTMPKPQAAPKRRRTWPIVKPDIDKLARAVLDAGTGVLWHDDSHVVQLDVVKAYPAEHPYALPVPGLVGFVYQLDPPSVPAGVQYFGTQS